MPVPLRAVVTGALISASVYGLDLQQPTDKEVGDLSLLRISLENYDQMQFVGKMYIGTPPQEFHVIFDTGSSDVWLPAASCDVCAGTRRYDPTASTTYRLVNEVFQLEYGSGNASGNVIEETISLGTQKNDNMGNIIGDLQLTNARVGSVTSTTKRLQRFHADGIFGLGLEALAMITKPSVFARNAKQKDAHSTVLLQQFSIYINPLPNAIPSSQLIFGGVDPALAGTTNPDFWHYFPLIPYPNDFTYGFWAIRMHYFSVSAEAEDQGEATFDNTLEQPYVSIRAGVAVFDSGTSLILFPPRSFNRTITAIQMHLQRHFGFQMHENAYAISGYTCSSCSAEMFPTLTFAFDKTSPEEEQEIENEAYASREEKQLRDIKMVMLQGTDYVRCDGDRCTPQLDVHALFGGGGAYQQSQEDAIVLGAIFLRSYYMAFDVVNKRIGFVCRDNGACRGGQTPTLQFYEHFLSRYRSELSWLFWIRVYLPVAGTILIFASIWLWMTTTAEMKLTLAWMRDKPAALSSSAKRLFDCNVLVQSLGHDDDDDRNGDCSAADKCCGGIPAKRKSICLDV